MNAFNARGLRNEPPATVSYRMSIECHNDQQVVDRIRMVMQRARDEVAQIIAEETVNDQETLFPLSKLPGELDDTLWGLDRYDEGLRLVDMERARS
jgi:hypothetical protein